MADSQYILPGWVTENNDMALMVGIISDSHIV